jgi:hypothetical protein
MREKEEEETDHFEKRGSKLKIIKKTNIFKNPKYVSQRNKQKIQ